LVALVLLPWSLALPGHANAPAPSGLGLSRAPLSRSGAEAYGSARAVSAAAAALARPASTIDVNRTYSHEPAPMGLADYGVSDRWTGYQYSTSAFLGTVRIRSMSASYHQTVGGTTYVGNDLGFQLNAELVLSHGSRNLTYWVQDVPILDTSNGYFAVEENVWNWTRGSGGVLPANTMVGNGTIDSNALYVDVAPSSYPGEGVNLTMPVNISAEIVASSIGGLPHLAMRYDDGYGMVTYDNATFPWAHGWTVTGFFVDGLGYAPNGLYYDVEWVQGGPGDGIQDTLGSGNYSMELQYYNGHNFQALENAFDYGANTAEGIGNIVPAYATLGGGGAPVVHESAGSSGKLGLVYGRSQLALLNLSCTLPDATITVGSTQYPVRGGGVNLTLVPGNYTIVTSNATRTAPEFNVTLSAGEYLALTVGRIPLRSPVWFNETGLPAGTNWTVTIGNTTYPTANDSLGLRLLNGTYAYRVAGLAGWRLVGRPYSGTFTLPGNATFALLWGPDVYAVTFSEDGLPSGTPWSVALGGPPQTSDNGTLVLDLANGTYLYRVAVAYAFLPEEAEAEFAVDGMPVPVEVGFMPRYATLAGTVTPSATSLFIDGSPLETGAASYDQQIVAGVHILTANLTGYVPFSANVTLTPANTTVYNVRLTPIAVAPGPGPAPSSGTGWNDVDSVGVGLIAVVVVAAAVLIWSRSRARR
jgi:hypothetical protein